MIGTSTQAGFNIMSTEKPISPHIQIYRWEITMLTSILHRAAGIALAVGTLLLVWMLLALASGEEAYACFRTFITSPVGTILLLGWSGALFFHMGNGFRHLVMDTGHGYTIAAAKLSSFMVFVFAVLMTMLVWFVACPWQ